MKKRHVGAALGVALAIPFIAPPAVAAPAGDHVVINEVYVRGGNADGVYRDYVELYNPTSSPIALDGMS